MSWRLFGYLCCLTSGFNFVVFQVLTASLGGPKPLLPVLPDRIITVHAACIACSIIHFIAMLISAGYLSGFIKFDPFDRVLRFLRSTVGLSPVSGSMRYHRITENGAALPMFSEDVVVHKRSH